ncbi:hypothetical protein [Agriterribacter sp.]|uniref:hypothetical protein n=1 Tax=Agriterribacter sp. TaxID=2821509 RepID=UPI002C05F759|nr:hypothetical protein [Agriterribacter sp.]HRO47660.1 hypothetical protein [Agriterribacter sp.]HRQ19636.1 hypothetical protein [Agriterribacter sp.]
MRFVLYRYKKTPKGTALQYVKEIKNGKVIFSTLTYDAQRFSLIKAISLAVRYRLFWIHKKHLRVNL